MDALHRLVDVTAFPIYGCHVSKCGSNRFFLSKDALLTKEEVIIIDFPVHATNALSANVVVNMDAFTSAISRLFCLRMPCWQMWLLVK